MDLLYLLLPIIGAFVMLFTVCCCGKKVKELLHMPKEIALGRPVREFELQDRPVPDTRQVARESRQRCPSGGSQLNQQHSQDTLTIADCDTQPLVHQSPLVPCHKRYLGDVTEQELETLLRDDSSRLRHDSGIATCSCHRSLMSVEVAMDSIRIEEEEDSAVAEDTGDVITVIGTQEDAHIEPVLCRAHLEAQIAALSHLQGHHHQGHPQGHPQGHRNVRRKSGGSSTSAGGTANVKLHRSLCEGLHTTTAGLACRCSAAHLSRNNPLHRRPLGCPPTERAVEDSRRRHLSVGSCDTAHSDVVVHMVDDDDNSDTFS